MPLEWWGDRDRGERVTEHDRLLILALREFERGLCDCGQHKSESMAPQHDADDPEATATYVTGEPFRCHACTAIAKSQRAHLEALGPEHADYADGQKWGVELVARKPRSAVLQ